VHAGWIVVAVLTGLLALHCSSDGNDDGSSNPQPAPSAGATGTVRLVVRGLQ
jgi:hypothetical protein